MKKLSIISLVLVAAVTIFSCSEVKRNPSKSYMPDMAYSRAYETYASNPGLAENNIHYNGMPVPGTIKRGEIFPFPIAQDQAGDSTNYVASKKIVNPLPALDSAATVEAHRIYLINCGICHGSDLKGNGPLWKDGEGAFPSAPKNLVDDAGMKAMPDGQMFYSITYGKNLMGPYGSQLTTTQRWQIIHYIKTMQGQGAKATAQVDAAQAKTATTPAE